MYACVCECVWVCVSVCARMCIHIHLYVQSEDDLNESVLGNVFPAEPLLAHKMLLREAFEHLLWTILTLCK